MADVVFSEASLAGQYAFAFTRATATGDLSFSVGLFQANGRGILTNGIRDLQGSAGVFTDVPFTGSYSVGPDGRGTVTLAGSNWTWFFSILVLSNDKAQLMLFDPWATGSGVLERQEGAPFSIAALNGDFSFVMKGVTAGEPGASAGRFTLNGRGGISAGLCDVNHAGTVSTGVPFTGTYNTDTNGRGTLALTGASGTQQYSLYILSGDRLWLFSLEPSAAFVGVVERQQASAFDNSTLSGAYIFTDYVAPLLVNPPAAVGRFTADGAGNTVSGTVERASLGIGVVTETFVGTYVISASGRGTMPARGLSFYMVSTEKAFVLDLTSTVGQAGVFEAQQGVPFTTASLAGRFGFHTNLVAVTGERFSSQGQFVADDAGNFNGTQDTNGAGISIQAERFEGAHYSVDPNGRGTWSDPNGAVPPAVFYVVSSSKYYILGSSGQSGAVLAGIAEKQF